MSRNHEDLEDAICRVRWAAEIAWELAEEGSDEDAKTKAAHALRTTVEQARRLFEIFYSDDDAEVDPAFADGMRITAQLEADRDDMRKRAAVIRGMAA